MNAAFGKVFHTFFYDDVTGCAGAATAAGVFQVDMAVDGDIQNGFRLTVIIVRQFAGFKFNCCILRQEGYFRHYNYSGICAVREGATPMQAAAATA